MTTPALDDVRAQFDTYAVQFIALQQQPLERLTGDALEALSTMLHTADAVLATLMPAPIEEDSERAALVAWVRLLRSAVIRLLAVAGPAASWGDAQQEALSLTAGENWVVARLLLDPPEPAQYLRDVAERYRATLGL